MRRISEDGLLDIYLHDVVSYTFAEGCTPQLEVNRKNVRQAIEPVTDITKLEGLMARLEERKMCMFHEFSSRCMCFHCKRIAYLEEQIRQEREKLE